MTDGEENSREWTYDAVKALIEQKEKEGVWIPSSGGSARRLGSGPVVWHLGCQCGPIRHQSLSPCFVCALGECGRCECGATIKYVRVNLKAVLKKQAYARRPRRAVQRYDSN
jgi:hypothetical protein